MTNKRRILRKFVEKNIYTNDYGWNIDFDIGKDLHMKRISLKKLFKRLLILIFAIYVIYTFIMQQQTLNAYKAEEKQYNQEIENAQEEQKKLIATKNNINSDEYIEQIAREKLDMYLPNERVYIDIGK